MRELEEQGYVIRERVRNSNGQLGAIEYTILEQPRPPEREKPERENPVQVNPILDSPVLGKPEQGNPAQLNTKESSKQKSKKDLSSTEISNPIQSNPPAPAETRIGTDGMGAREIYREIVLDNIGYEYLIQDSHIDREQLDEIAELIVDTVCSARKTIRIAGDDYPAEVVKSRFMKLDSSHVQYVMDCMRENTTYVRNIKKYLLAALYNAPSTISNYYSSLVQHDKATPPKLERKEAETFQPEEVQKIRDCLEYEPIKWKTITHLLLITGCRRGEIMGLKWADVEWDRNRVKIARSLLYSPARGVYEDTTKTGNIRRISLPSETIQLLKAYRAWYSELQLKNGDRWQDSGYLFVQDNGAPMNPDSLTDWLNKFSKRYGIPNVHPHKFRHTMASLLYFGGLDSITISKRLGHAKVSTTTDIYSHIIQQADEQAADRIAETIFRAGKKEIG